MKYTPLQLDTMRWILQELYVYHHNPFRQDEMLAQVERQLVTYMSQETTPEELREYVDKIFGRKS